MIFNIRAIESKNVWNNTRRQNNTYQSNETNGNFVAKCKSEFNDCFIFIKIPMLYLLCNGTGHKM